MKRVILNTFGSLGDLNPFIALARGLRQRGFLPVVATSDIYRDIVQAAGIDFHPVRPNLDLVLDDNDLLHRTMHPRKGTEVIIREIVFPYLRQTYADLNQILRPDDTLITHSISYAGHIAAQKHDLNWISVVLSPIAFFSSHDMPVLSGLPFSHWLQKLGPATNRLLIRAIKSVTQTFCGPVYRLRAELGLSRGKHPLFEGQHSPKLVLAMFSDLLSPPQPDWPPNTHITGFGFYDAAGDQSELTPELARFLESGPPPLVFTLGSSAVFVAGDFYQRAVRVAARLKRRAVLVVGKDTSTRPPEGFRTDTLAVEYAPFSKLFPRAAAIVCSGGIGTTGQVLQAGKISLCVPVANDQPDNARRIQRLGISRTLPFGKCSVRRMVGALEELLQSRQITERAAAIGEKIRCEDGVAAACDAIEATLAGTA